MSRPQVITCKQPLQLWIEVRLFRAPSGSADFSWLVTGSSALGTDSRGLQFAVPFTLLFAVSFGVPLLWQPDLPDNGRDFLLLFFLEGMLSCKERERGSELEGKKFRRSVINSGKVNDQLDQVDRLGQQTPDKRDADTNCNRNST